MGPHSESKIIPNESHKAWMGNRSSASFCDILSAQRWKVRWAGDQAKLTGFYPDAHCVVLCLNSICLCIKTEISDPEALGPALTDRPFLRNRWDTFIKPDRWPYLLTRNISAERHWRPWLAPNTREEYRDSFQQGRNAFALPDRMEYRDLFVRDDGLNRLMSRWIIYRNSYI